MKLGFVCRRLYFFIWPLTMVFVFFLFAVVCGLLQRRVYPFFFPFLSLFDCEHVKIKNHSQKSASCNK